MCRSGDRIKILQHDYSAEVDVTRLTVEKKR
jgi:hypothetical protein